MSRLFRIGRQEQPELGGLESLLKDVLEPVTPRQDYVKDLNRRLSNYSMTSPLIVAPSISKEAFWTVIGLISGIVLIVIGIRAIVILLEGMISIYRDKHAVRID